MRVLYGVVSKWLRVETMLELSTAPSRFEKDAPCDGLADDLKWRKQLARNTAGKATARGSEESES